ncbi:MAG: methyltransferase domain-containing protein [Candidatus Altiarchaeales archaeon]|nr:methyltransferase domain-containing protein [Candidatus Altiarchaeales archaeon]MBD3415906.1 methyltransferase domain-containing protein [Candidatus Altiarchaeales archaeon]
MIAVDLGCGEGFGTNKLLNEFPDAERVYGLDFNEASLRKARKTFTDPRLDFRKADLTVTGSIPEELKGSADLVQISYPQPGTDGDKSSFFIQCLLPAAGCIVKPGGKVRVTTEVGDNVRRAIAYSKSSGEYRFRGSRDWKSTGVKTFTLVRKLERLQPEPPAEEKRRITQ